MAKAGRFGGTAGLSYKGKVHKGELNKPNLIIPSLIMAGSSLWSGLRPVRGGLTPLPGPLGIPPQNPRTLGLIRGVSIKAEVRTMS